MNKAICCSKLFCEMRHKRRQLPQQIKSCHFKRQSWVTANNRGQTLETPAFNLLRLPTYIIDIVDNSTFVYQSFTDPAAKVSQNYFSAFFAFFFLGLNGFKAELIQCYPSVIKQIHPQGIKHPVRYSELLICNLCHVR